MADLPTGIDASYADDPADSSVKTHQQHHGRIHEIVNTFPWDDVATWANGAVAMWNSSTDRWEVTDPLISGSPGPTGDTGRGIIWMGEWNPATTYHVATANDPEAYEFVTWLGNVYVALTTHADSEPTYDSAGLPLDSTQWGVVVSKGSDGAAGVDGPAGPQGAAGVPGPAAEAVNELTSVTGSLTVDFGQYSYYVITLTGNATITIADTSGVAVSKGVIRIYQAGSGSNVITWVNPSWALADGLPPILGTAVGDLNVVAFDQVGGVWIGYAPGAGTGNEPPVIVPPPDVFDTLDMEAWVDVVDTTDKTGVVTYVMGSSTTLGAKRGGLAAVVTTRSDNVDPPIPGLTGAGASSWTVIATNIFGTASTRRRLTVFAARDAAAAAAAPFTVSLPAAGALHSGCALKAVRTVGLVDTTWLAMLLATVQTTKYNDVGQTSSSAGVALGTPADAADRTVMFVANNVGGAAGLTVEAGAELTGSVLNLSAPVIGLWSIFYPDAFDTFPQATVSLSNWTAIAMELEQGGAIVPPPAGIPPIDVELMFSGYNSTDQSADYLTNSGFTTISGSGASLLVGSERMGIVDVVTSTGISADPNEPTLAGGGITTWAVAGTRVLGTGANRRRITRFIGWQDPAGASAPLTIGVGAQATTSVGVQVWRTTQTDDAARDAAVANTVVRYYLDAGENAAGPARATLGTAVNADSRPFAVGVWNTNLSLMGTVTDEAGYTLESAIDTGGSPASHMRALFHEDVFEDTPSWTWTGGAFNWAVIATELPQAV